MGYVEDGPEPPHRCNPPTEGYKIGDTVVLRTPRAGDVWECPDCERRHYCRGWHFMDGVGSFPTWKTTPPGWWWRWRLKRRHREKRPTP